jgi:hypothetical protein
MAHPEWPCGTFLWAKLSGLALWPGIVWSIDKVTLTLTLALTLTLTLGFGSQTVSGAQDRANMRAEPTLRPSATVLDPPPN